MLQNEIKRIYRDEKYITEHEKSFSSLTKNEQIQICLPDKYSTDDFIFIVQGKEIRISNEKLANALIRLDNAQRDTILQSYFLMLKDAQIAKQNNVVRQTITKRRASTLKKLKSIMTKGELS